MTLVLKRMKALSNNDRVLLMKTMSKSALREYDNKNRAMTGFNTGERVFKSAKDYDRNDFKEVLRDEIAEYDSDYDDFER